LQKANKGRLIWVSERLPGVSLGVDDYRAHRLILWLRAQGWDVVLLVCPPSGESLCKEDVAAAGINYGKVIVCHRDGLVIYHLPGDDLRLDKLCGQRPRLFVDSLHQGEARSDVPETREDVRAVCPEVVIEVLLHLEREMSPKAVFAAGVCMSRPFALLEPGLLRIVDTGNARPIIPAQVQAELLSHADLAIATEQDGADTLQKLGGNLKIAVVGVDYPVANVAPAPVMPIVVVDVGHDAGCAKAVRDFLHLAWPLVLREVPDAKLYVVGSTQERIEPVLPGIRIVVDEEAVQAYQQARLIINPVFASSGSQRKTLEALCQLRPVVTWPSAVDGLACELRELCHIATDWFDFARHVIRLATSDSEARRVVESRDQLANRFEAGKVYAPLAAALAAVEPVGIPRFAPVGGTARATSCEDAHLEDASVPAFQQPACDVKDESAIYDVYIDLSSSSCDGGVLDDYLSRVASLSALADTMGHISVVTPPDQGPRNIQPDLDLGREGESPIVLLERAVRRAAARRRHLLVLLAPLLPSGKAVVQLGDCFDLDPMFGTAQPRFTDRELQRVWPIPGGGQNRPTERLTSRAALQFMADYSITPEFLGACTLLRWNMLASVDKVDHEYRSVAGALFHMLCQARRRGMRNVVLNKVTVASELGGAVLYPALPDADLARLRAAYPDSARAEMELSRLAQPRLEPLLAAARVEARYRRVLLDCRGIGSQHNGTAQCVIGLLQGLAALECAPQIDVLVLPEAAKFHGLRQRYSQFHYSYGLPEGEYSSAVTLTQPWALNTLIELHQHALVIAFNMLDTIQWDVIYASGNDTLGALWKFVAQYSDGLLYNSHFTQARYRMRFPVSSDVRECVTHHSFRAEEYVDDSAQATGVSDYILVFGNEYDHKDLLATLRLLTDGFPLNRVVVFGTDRGLPPRIQGVPSGSVGRAELHKMIAAARVIVYPSFYEGFGLPAVEALAYGRPVLVRSSPLWREIAGSSRLRGQLLEFDDGPSFVDTLGRVLAGMPIQGLPRGVCLAPDTSPADWKECARRMMQLVDDCLATVDGSRWLARDEALSLVALNNAPA
jgi:glycosyltransferase involved in cell wall biosynthesis